MAKVGFDSVELGTKLPGVVRFVDQKVITKNAVASLDFNPIHVDPAWAKKVNLLGQGTTIAHGMCTMSFMASAITDWCHASGGFISRMETKFIEPVRPGDTITCNGVVTELHPRQEGRSFVVLELSAENQKGVKVSSGKADVRLPR